MTGATPALRLALDQNFPTPLIRAVAENLPPDEPWELAAIIRTQAVVVAVEGLGHDPLRAVGALLLDLPGLANRIRRQRSNVFLLSYRRRPPRNAREYLKAIAERQGRTDSDLWEEVLVTADEFDQARLD